MSETVIKAVMPVVSEEKEIVCPKHGKYWGKTATYSFGVMDKTFSTPCPKCEEDDARRVQREAREKEIQGLIAMNIGRRYWGIGFEDFETYTDELRHHLEIARKYADHPEGKLVMLGNNGTGKTHLAVSVLKKTGGVIYTAYEVGVRLRQSFNGDSKEWEVLKELCETPLLVLDEIGRTKGSDFDLNWLSHVINKRHENLLPLILISNRHLMENCPEGEKGCPKCLENFFDNDVISRIIEDGIVMKFTSDDYRYKKRATGRVTKNGA